MFDTCLLCQGLIPDPGNPNREEESEEKQRERVAATLEIARKRLTTHMVGRIVDAAAAPIKQPAG